MLATPPTELQDLSEARGYRVEQSQDAVWLEWSPETESRVVGTGESLVEEASACYIEDIEHKLPDVPAWGWSRLTRLELPACLSTKAGPVDDGIFGQVFRRYVGTDGEVGPGAFAELATYRTELDRQLHEIVRAITEVHEAARRILRVWLLEVAFNARSVDIPYAASSLWLEISYGAPLRSLRESGFLEETFRFGELTVLRDSQFEGLSTILAERDFVVGTTDARNLLLRRNSANTILAAASRGQLLIGGRRPSLAELQSGMTGLPAESGRGADYDLARQLGTPAGIFRYVEEVLLPLDMSWPRMYEHYETDCLRLGLDCYYTDTSLPVMYRRHVGKRQG